MVIFHNIASIFWSNKCSLGEHKRLLKHFKIVPTPSLLNVSVYCFWHHLFWASGCHWTSSHHARTAPLLRGRAVMFSSGQSVSDGDGALPSRELIWLDLHSSAHFPLNTSEAEPPINCWNGFYILPNRNRAEPWETRQCWNRCWMETAERRGDVGCSLHSHTRPLVSQSLNYKYRPPLMNLTIAEGNYKRARAVYSY